MLDAALRGDSTAYSPAFAEGAQPEPQLPDHAAAVPAQGLGGVAAAAGQAVEHGLRAQHETLRDVAPRWSGVLHELDSFTNGRSPADRLHDTPVSGEPVSPSEQAAVDWERHARHAAAGTSEVPAARPAPLGSGALPDLNEDVEAAIRGLRAEGHLTRAPGLFEDDEGIESGNDDRY